MKLEAMKRQGARTDLTSSKTVTETSDQVGPKLDNPTLVTHKMALYDDFSEEFNYRKKHYGVRETSRIVEVHEKNRGAR